MLLFAALRHAAAQPAADLVLLNGRVWTGDKSRPQAQAVACRLGRIVAVGSTEEIRAWVGADAEVVDLKGQRVVPGFHDAHVHFLTGGMHLAGVQLRDARSQADFRNRIARFASRLPQGRWITGGDWDHENWTPADPPTRELIDAATPAHPVFVNRLDGHMALANSLALNAAGISRATPDPPGGEIVRDARGEPTGLLKDAAMEAVYRVIPPASPEEIDAALRAAMGYAAENGVTSVQDMSATPEALAGYQRLLERGEMTVRVYGYQPLEGYQRLAAVGVRAGFGGEKLKIGGMKAFADGSLGSTTALFFEPYSDAPHTAGLPAQDMIPESRLLERIMGADRAGLQVAVHAIGDKANHLVLESRLLERIMGADRAGLQVAVHAIGDKANHLVLGMFEEASKRNEARDRRFRIEHAQHLRREDMARFGRLRVIASMQPYHAIDDGRWAEKRIGPARARGSYAFRSLLDAGAVLAFGSDWYVAPMEPLMGIYAAVTRRTLDGQRPGGWVPEEKVSVEEALRAYTYGSAYAAFEERIKGIIEPGKLADLAVLSEDILSIDPAAIRQARVVMTVFDGRVIHRR